MYPLNDKDLDRLSREAAEQYDVEASASGWERLEQRLDQELPVNEKRRRRFLLWLTFTVLITGGSLVWMLGGAPGNTETIARTAEVPGGRTDAPATALQNKRPQNDQPGVSGQTGHDRPATGISSDAGTGPDSHPSNGGPVSGNEPNAASQNNVQPLDHSVSGNNADNGQKADKPVSPASGTGVLPEQSSEGSAEKDITTESNRKNNSTAQNRNPSLTKDNNDRPPIRTKDDGPPNESTVNAKNKSPEASRNTPRAEQTVPGKERNDMATGKPGEPTAVGGNEALTERKEIAATRPEVAADPATTIVDVASFNPSTQPVVVEPLPPFRRPTPIIPVPKWEFGITAGPDFSHVKNKYFEGVGFNAGVSIGYRISNRWLINTGLIYAKKEYKAAGEDFNPKYWNPVPNWKMEEATGNCAMLEIPLNIRYDFRYNHTHRFFVSAGASSYLMDNESYICLYRDETGNAYYDDWSSDTNTDYFLSNINLSAGYERRLGSRFSLQAEPYVKLPTRKVGWGNINLGSYGVLFTLKYKPVSGNRKKR